MKLYPAKIQLETYKFKITKEDIVKSFDDRIELYLDTGYFWIYLFLFLQNGALVLWKETTIQSTADFNIKIGCDIEIRGGNKSFTKMSQVMQAAFCQSAQTLFETENVFTRIRDNDKPPAFEYEINVTLNVT